MRKIGLFGLFFCLLLGLSGQIRIRGRIVDAATDEGLPLANLVDGASRLLATANDDGQFSFSLSLGDTDSVYISYVGYRDKTFAVANLDPLQIYTIRLNANAELPTVEVRLPRNAYGPSTAILTPSVSELERVPALLGEVDLLQSLSLLPGISVGTEGSAALNIRGGNPNQTDLLIDGNRIYNVNHFGGVLSALPPFATKALTVYKGGMPPRFGGRLSGVANIILKEGRRDQSVKSFTLGLGMLQVGLEGPSGKTGSFLVSARYSYPTVVVNIAQSSQFERYQRGDYTTVGIYDFVGKYRYRLGSHQFTGSAFISGDQGFDQSDLRSNTITSDDFQWGNRSFTLEHRYTNRTGSVLTSTLQYLNYGFSFDGRRFVRPVNSQEEFRAVNVQKNQVNDLVGRTELVVPFGNTIDITMGIWLTHHRFRTTVNDTYIDTDGTEEFGRVIHQEALETATYLSADIRTFADRLQLMAGIRSSGLGALLPANLEPRARLTFSLAKPFSINASIDRNYQYIHQLTPEVALFPNELYLIDDDRFPAERSDQIAFGFGGVHRNLQWSLEAFRKQQSDLVRFLPGRERDRNFIDVYPDNVIGRGKGRMSGLEAYVKRDTDQFSYSVAYTLSRSERSYAEINEGEWFPFTFDRRHDLGITASKKLGSKWRLNGSFVYQTGYSFTAPIAQTAFFNIFGEFNGARLPPFHLLNLSATKSWQGKKRPERYHKITYSLYNTYNRPNAYSVDLVPRRTITTNPVTGETVETVRIEAVTLSLLPIIPGINYTLTIK